VDDNPLEGKAPQTIPKALIRITKKKVHVLWTRKPKANPDIHAAHKNPKKEWVLRATSFLWLYAWVAILMLIGAEPTKPVPHFYYALDYAGCNYVSIHGDFDTRSPPNCPPIWFRQDNVGGD
jgi:hypothetical protein